MAIDGFMQPLMVGGGPRKYSDIVHPEWSSVQKQRIKWRLTYEGGELYIDEYLRKFRREKWQDWYERKFLTYVPPFAKEAVNEIINSVFQRLGDVTRVGGQAYIDACKGLNGGVDRTGTTMSAFIGEKVLPEMLPMREIGVWVDMPAVDPKATKAEAIGKQPYFYTYPAESIKSWAYDDENKLTAVLLREITYTVDPDTGLPMEGDVEQFRFAKLVELDGRMQVQVRIEKDNGNEISKSIIDIPEIPFHVFKIKHSLLQDVADMQKALLNMESADVYWCVKAGFPIYTEMKDGRAGSVHLRPAQQAPKGPGYPNVNAFPGIGPTDPPIPSGQAQQASEAKDVERSLGITAGISYGRDLTPPAFIHPSSEPLTATMAKEQQIKEDIRRSVHLSVAMLDPRMASAESKQMDDQGLQNGLLAIGMALEKGERRLAHIWSLYLKAQDPTVRYPEQWTMQSDSSRRADATALCELKDQIPSRKAQREILKQAADKLIGHKVAPEVLDQIHAEIDAAECLTTNIDDLEKEIQLRMVSAETASANRGYPKGEHSKALKEQADQLAIIAISQAKAGGAGAARGVPGDPGNTDSKDEKKLAAGGNGTPTDAQRGPAK